MQNNQISKNIISSLNKQLKEITFDFLLTISYTKNCLDKYDGGDQSLTIAKSC